MNTKNFHLTSNQSNHHTTKTQPKKFNQQNKLPKTPPQFEKRRPGSSTTHLHSAPIPTGAFPIFRTASRKSQWCVYACWPRVSAIPHLDAGANKRRSGGPFICGKWDKAAVWEPLGPSACGAKLGTQALSL